MSDSGFLLALPTQSITVRLLLGATVAVLSGRLLLRAGLRVPRVRVGAALVPVAAIVTILMVSLGALRPPSLMVPSGAGGSVVLQLEGTYAYLAPLALPALVGIWAVVAASRACLRLARARREAQRAGHTVTSGSVPARVERSLRRVATRMGLDAPPIGVVEGCQGGATVVGIRRPVVLLDADLVGRLDDRELEGVIAHELAHVRRRDNLMALVLGLVRDVAFFVPGGRWALRHLLVERELAADQFAVDTTARPGALAGGLLKVLESAGGGQTCAALLPTGTLVRRVEALVDDRPPPTRSRVSGEVVSLAATFALVVGVAAGVPRLAAGTDPDGGIGVLVTAPAATAPAPATEAPAAHEARAFATYRNSAVATPSRQVIPKPAVDDEPGELRASLRSACAAGVEACRSPASRPGLALRPTPQLLDDATLQIRWRAHQVVDTGQVVRFVRLSSPA